MMGAMNRIRTLTRGPKAHFYGYYGFNPWDATGRLHLALETDFDRRPPLENDCARVGVVDRDTGEFRALAETRAFNFQQGSMLHWIDAGYGEEITCNDWDGGIVISRASTPSRGACGGSAARSPTWRPTAARHSVSTTAGSTTAARSSAMPTSPRAPSTLRPRTAACGSSTWPAARAGWCCR